MPLWHIISCFDAINRPSFRKPRQEKTPGAAGQRARAIAHLVVLECHGRGAFRKVL